MASNPDRGVGGEYLESGAAESREIGFEDFSLDSLEWKRGGSERNEGAKAVTEITESTAERKLVINGTPCTISARMKAEADMSVSGEIKDYVLIHLQIVGPDEKDVLWGGINSGLGYRGRNDQVLVETTISKKSDNPRFRGLGIQFYEKMLDFIASGLGKSLGNKAVRHEVQRSPFLTTMGQLSDERWDEIFSPILEARGYTKTRDGFFEREYPAPGEPVGE